MADERFEIEGTLAILRESLESDLQQRGVIDQRIAEKERRIAFWQKKLAEIGNTEGPIKKRLPKGEPKRLLLAAFAEHGNGLTQAALAQYSGLKLSTARATLENDKGAFSKDPEGRWHLRANGSAVQH